MMTTCSIHLGDGHQLHAYHMPCVEYCQVSHNVATLGLYICYLLCIECYIVLIIGDEIVHIIFSHLFGDFDMFHMTHSCLAVTGVLQQHKISSIFSPHVANEIKLTTPTLLDITIDITEWDVSQYDCYAFVCNENKLLHMFIYDMTSNHGIAYFFHQFCLPMVGWFNDEHCKFFDMNMNFTYICTPSCNIFMSYTSRDVSSVKWFNDEHYLYIHVSHVQQQLRSIKMDDIYIY